MKYRNKTSRKLFKLFKLAKKESQLLGRTTIEMIEIILSASDVSFSELIANRNIAKEIDEICFAWENLL